MKLKRPLFSPDDPRGPSHGSDVTGIKRGYSKYENDFFPRPPGGFDDVANRKFFDAVYTLRSLEDRWPLNSPAFRQDDLDAIWPHMDAYARYLYWRFKVPVPQPAMCSPLKVGRVPTFLHPTAGLLGNWALDWMAPGGTPVYAAEDAKIKKLSGRDPSSGADQQIGIFGWSIHYETAKGYRYFGTHFGKRENLIVGQSVKAGDKLGEVGDWPGDPGRSHLHLGVTSPLGESDAKKRIQAVAAASRV